MRISDWSSDVCSSDLHGQLVGIPSNILSRSGGNIGIGFAIPINQARSVMSQLIEHGSVQRGRIGVGGQDVTPDRSEARRVGKEGVSMGRYRWSRSHKQKKNNE